MRADLAALGPDAVAALANAGLVKRAQREIAEGKGPALEEGADGVVVGTCPDGAVVRWPPSTSLRDATCSCGAPGACRHRVAVALSYRDWEKSTRHASTDASPPSSQRFEAWSPGDIDDAALADHLGPRTVEAARVARARGVIVRVRAATPKDPIPSAALPSCTVRFLAPRAIALSRCDCQVAEACAHIALAVWAFRLVDATAPTSPDGDAGAERTVELTGGKAASIDLEAMEPLRALARWVLGAGVSAVAASDAFDQRAVLARAPLEARGYVWMLGLLEDLEETITAYRRRAAGYRARAALEIVAEIEARARSASAPPHELPASFIVGRDTPLETKLDHLRLTSLGARVTVDEEGTTVRLLLANPETGDVLALDKTFAAEAVAAGMAARASSKPEPIDARAAGARRLGGSSIGAIATGHVVTRSAVRRANDALRLGSSTRGTTSVTPQSGDLSILPSPRRAESADALVAHLRGRAPALLRPRRLGEDVFVLGVATVEGAAFDAAEQAVFATIGTASGTALLVRHHRRGAPHALDAVASALAGKFGALRWIAGEVDVEHDVLRIVPTMLCADRVIVPDFEEDPPRLALPVGRVPSPSAGAAAARSELVERLTEVVHAGVTALPPTFPERLRRASEAARREGMKALAARGDALAAAIQGKPADVFDRWSDAAIRAQL